MESGLNVTDGLQTPVERVRDRTKPKNLEAISCCKLGYVHKKIKITVI